MARRPAGQLSAGHGKLVLVVGPSGAGKDTLMAGARTKLAGDRRVLFVRRVVTRQADESFEDHETMDPDAFAAAREAGAFSLWWEAHGLAYGIPRSTEDAIAAGQIAVCNGSRRILGDVANAFPGAVVISVTVPKDILARRLIARGREDAEAVASRLARDAIWPAPGLRVIEVDNSGSVAEGVERFTRVVAGLVAGN